MREKDNRALPRGNELLRTVSRLQSEFMSDAAPHQLFNGLLPTVLSLTQSKVGFIGEVPAASTEDSSATIPAARNTASNPGMLTLHAESAPTGRGFKKLLNAVMTTGESVITNQAATDPRCDGLFEGHSTLESFLALPVYHAGQLVGIFGIGNRPNGYDSALAIELQPLLETCGNIIHGYRLRERRKRAEEALRASEKRLRLLLETTNAIPWEASIDTWQFTYVGPQAVKLLGYRVEKWYEKDFWPAHIHPQDREFAIDFCEKSARRAKDYEFEYRMIAADGNIVWLHDIVSVVSVDGTPKTLRGFMVDITESKQAEEALRESEARYRAVVESQTELICRFLLDTTLTFVNDAYCDYFGKKREELIGQSFLTLIPEDGHPVVWQHVNALMANPGIRKIEYEHEVLLPNGNIGWQQWIDHAIVDSQGHVIEFQSVGRDITQRKQAEEALRASEERYRNLIEGSIQGILIHRNWKPLYVNQAYTDILGYESPDEILAMETREPQIAPYDRARVRRYREARLKGEEAPTAYEFDAIRQDGSIVTLQNLVRVIEWEGQPAIQSTVIDITERKQAEDALRASEERYRTLVEYSPYSIHEIDLEGRLSSTNPAGFRMMGVTSERDIKGTPYWDAVSDDDRDRIGVLLERAYRGQSSEFEFRAVNGLDFQSSLVPITNDNGVVIKLMGLTQDITERKQAQGDLEKALAEVARLKDQLQAENIYLREEIDLDHNFGEIIGQNEGLKKVLLKVEQVAATDATVLILGETGTGKELLARAIHRLSQRKDRPLVKVSCATLPASLIESELFGHEKGAFTGAVSKQVGRFELAHGATILLDEIGELALNLQAKLLRVLQEGEFECLGSPRTFKVDVRIIATTNRELREAVRDGEFRQDLYQRLNVFPLVVPPLRERRDDIPLLVQSRVSRYARKLGKTIDTIPEPAMKALQSYPWPGNIRELENIIERAVIITPGTTLQIEDVLDLSQAAAAAGGQTLEDIECEHINRILQQTQWRIEGRSGAATVLGLKPATLRSRMQKLGIHRPHWRLP